ncbi:hypothetical protein HMPREF9442_00409 [Paraprevotella xylaniphila YIT 11841]|uniref:Uncharacterized protein n=1 Tax=Paraprevotella xylaniphila YIT 11841 TaxID=762982 RepID=F3QQG7_9BACT|nr:hypothetical protein HMPREF9442_00409 [Paraprevotella xylaniphila YIT 11841]
MGKYRPFFYRNQGHFGMKRCFSLSESLFMPFFSDIRKRRSWQIHENNLYKYADLKCFPA